MSERGVFLYFFSTFCVHINSTYLKVVVSLLGNRLTKRGSLVELLEEKERRWSKRLAWLVEKLARPGLDRAHWRSVHSPLDLVPILRHRSSRRFIFLQVRWIHCGFEKSKIGRSLQKSRWSCIEASKRSSFLVSIFVPFKQTSLSAIFKVIFNNESSRSVLMKEMKKIWYLFAR